MGACRMAGMAPRGLTMQTMFRNGNGVVELAVGDRGYVAVRWRMLEGRVVLGRAESSAEGANESCIERDNEHIKPTHP